MNIHDEYRQAYVALEKSAQTGQMTWEGAMARVALLSIAYGEARASRVMAEMISNPEKVPS